VIVTSQVSGGRRRRPASSSPQELVGEPQDTTPSSDVHVLGLALTLIVVVTAWALVAAWWALR